MNDESIEIIKIEDFEYYKDEYNSYHRVLSKEDYTNIISFYQSHLYLDGEFEAEDLIEKLTEKQLERKFQNDIKRSQRIFEILRVWGLVPQENARILDIGCGYGIFLDQWIRKGLGCGSGIEISNLSKKLSQKLNPNLQIEIVDVNSIENIVISKDVSFVFAFDILEHLFNVEESLNILSTKTKKGVVVVAELPIIHSNFDRKRLEKYKYLYPTRHVHLYTREAVKTLFVKAGFKIINSLLIKDNSKLLIAVKKCKN